MNIGVALILIGGLVIAAVIIAGAISEVGVALDLLARTINVAERGRVQLAEGEKIANALTAIAEPIETIVAELQQCLEEERAAQQERGLRS
jgi:hypothetical protein